MKVKNLAVVGQDYIYLCIISEIVKYMLNEVKEVSKEQNSPKEIYQLVSSSHDTVILGVFKSAEDKLYKTWVNAGMFRLSYLIAFSIYKICSC